MEEFYAEKRSAVSYQPSVFSYQLSRDGSTDN